MAAELPYFRFTVAEWMNGDISMEDYACKGLFIDVCAWYWFKDCSVTKAMLEKKFNKPHALQLLYDSEVIKLDDESVHIEFLNDQFDILSEKRKVRQAAGSKGGKQKSSNAKAMLKQKPSYKDNNKDKDKEKNNTTSPRKCLMKNSSVTIPQVVEAFVKTNDIKNADAQFYFNQAMDWSDSKNEYRSDWVATVRGFARRDLKDGKMKLSVHKQDGGSNLSIKEPTPAPEPVSETAMTLEQYRKQKEEKK